jgi:hypothetical protein
MTDEPDITELQTRILEALAVQIQEANFNPSVSAGISDEKLARQLGVSTEKLQEAMQDLIDRGFITREPQPERPAPRTIDDPWPSPLPPCRRCGKASDGLDHLCTRCRAIWACDELVRDLTNALECFPGQPVVAARIRAAAAGPPQGHGGTPRGTDPRRGAADADPLPLDQEHQGEAKKGQADK